MQALVLMMQEIGIRKMPNGQHVVSWGKDGLDRILDGLGIYPGQCVHCYGKTGYDVRKELRANYTAIVISEGHLHREKLKVVAYLAKADGEGVLVRSFRDNGPGEIDLLHKRKLDPLRYSDVGVGSFAYANVSFMSQIELPEGGLVSYPSMVFGMVGNASTEREAAERVFDFMRKKMTHFIGDLNDFGDIYRPYTVTPYAPELAWVVYVGQAGSPSSSGAITGAFRALGMKAEQFLSEIRKRNAGSVEVDGQTYYYNGNDFLGSEARKNTPICIYFRTLEQVENKDGNQECANYR